jgi:hypothetical protein
MPDKDILKGILDTELLDEDARTAIASALEEAKEKAASEARAEIEVEKEAAITAAVAEAEIKIRADLAAKFVEDRERLIEAVDTRVDEMLSGHVDELKEDIQAFRDLEVEKALEIEEEKERLAEKFAAEREALVQKLDEYVGARLGSELEEFSEDLAVVKENSFGRQVYEAFQACYHESFVNDGALGPSAQDKIQEADKAREEAEERISALEEEITRRDRQVELERVLTPLSGKRKKVMETVLARVDTEKFDGVFETMIGKVLELTVEDDGAGTEVVTEGVEDDDILTEAPDGLQLETGQDDHAKDDVDPLNEAEKADIQAGHDALRKLIRTKAQA